MAGHPSSPLSTPKRKRSQLAGDEAPTLNTTRFSFDIVGTPPREDGNDSPRTNVAHRFRGLAIEGGGGAGHEVAGGSASPTPDIATRTTPAEDWDPMDEDTIIRKRVKLPEEADGVDLRQDGPSATAEAARVDRVDEPLSEPPSGAPLSGPKGEWETGLQVPTVDPAVVKPGSKPTGGRLHKSYPSINRLSDSKSRSSRKRAGTPPLAASKANPPGAMEQTGVDGRGGGGGDDADVEIVDPVRAALTWHTDEITVYDPEDEDDDGTGINGIGFKPTPAVAYSRTMRRKQQLAEYRKREERDARARRSHRRRASPGPVAAAAAAPVGSGAAEEAERKVRFMEAEPKSVVMT